MMTSDAWETDVEDQGHAPARQDLQAEKIAPPLAIAHWTVRTNANVHGAAAHVLFDGRRVMARVRSGE